MLYFSIAMVVSPRMSARLEAIDKLVHEGCKINKVWNAFPVIESSSGVVRNVFSSSPAGFSWIAFCFPFAVCAQIKEWSYFYVAGFVFLAGSFFYMITGWDPGFVLGTVIGVQYGFFYPYLRWQALQRGEQEFGVGVSVLVGILMSVLSGLPSIVFELLFVD